MSEVVEHQAYPLDWPPGWERTAAHDREHSRFSRRIGGTQDGRRAPTVADGIRDVLVELRRMVVEDWNVVISSNIGLRQDGLPYSNRRAPDDPGAAVYFRIGEDPHVLACDRWASVGENLRAIAKHIEALRGQDRWGVGSLARAFSGYTAIPEKTGGTSWWMVLGVPKNADLDEINYAYRIRAKRFHPDAVGGGNPQRWNELQTAIEQARGAVA